MTILRTLRGLPPLVLALLATLLWAEYVWADTDLPTKFSNIGTIGNTRHNLTQRQSSGGGPNGSSMDQYRNDYQEICVYCHTPHGANADVTLPLWNRTLKNTTYTVYSSTTLTNATVTQPGANSLACLSCHDGQTAVDSIINMPGAGRYLESQKTSQNNVFLNTWNNSRGPDATVHLGLTGTECLACHSSTAGFIGAGATDFSVFAIGTNLTNDHPIGVLLPTGEDWKVPTGTKGTTRFFDANGDGRMSSNEVRLYAGDRGPEVECASCHDPHGVPSGGAGSPFIKSFLRVTPSGSTICLTCHSK
ncbi:MAG TPA: cytochrome c3 family protein [Rhodocyclaceae bacterium]|nr:cytochrome c3 family protein [Rhodocyclaceae bacterium]